ncbi:hypothetical protein [Paenibacillus sp. NFR01]|uniref:hypothetical protein n=1 Tax=Paenibacillus sp. NFR01 TaxID=1566279 RepID=UPI0008BA6BAB|nr:hypothetical protein [Paenibacillus sp. NFR01]SEU27895.1 hypothetical protein SAMN03159358_4634 [Paenibacillus sp. NFR01]
MEMFIAGIGSLMANVAMVALFMMLTKLGSKFMAKKAKKGQRLFKRLDKALMKIHKPIGYTLILSATVHGALSVGSIPHIGIGATLFGGIALASAAGAAISFFIRKKFKPVKSWLYMHRGLSILALFSFCAHFVWV